MALGVVHVELGERSYSIYIGDEAWELFEENLHGRNSAGKAMVVTDERVNSIYGHHESRCKRWDRKSGQLFLPLQKGEAAGRFHKSG